ncbi:MAG: DinB family protein [Ferruginibacter sp.]|nr:DinB family protein [Ferruginibacter sp.]
MTKTEIIQDAEKIFSRFSQTCSVIDEPVFFNRPDEKWSVAENVQHIIISTNMSSLAWYLPRFVVRWMAGKPNRNSRTYDELKDKYYKKLADGGRASARFVPKPIEIKYGKQKLMDNWNKAAAKFINTLTKNRTEDDLDNYLVKHPLLGRITLRELGYFTIFHTEHHLHTIEKLTKTT